MEKEFVPYEQALDLKELGFDEEGFATIDQTDYLHIKGTKKIPRGSMIYDTIDCPTFSQAFRWFREKHGLHQVVLADVNGKYDIIVGERISGSCLGQYETHEEAELECLKKLIELANNK